MQNEVPLAGSLADLGPLPEHGADWRAISGIRRTDTERECDRLGFQTYLAYRGIPEAEWQGIIDRAAAEGRDTLRLENAIIAREAERSLHARGNVAPKDALKLVETKKPRRRRGTSNRKPRPLTARQAEVIQIVGEYKGNIARTAKRLGVCRKTVAEAYKAGMAKLGKTVVKHGTSHFARDRRGQAAIDADSDRRK